jgi:hypothetical protein
MTITLATGQSPLGTPRKNTQVAAPNVSGDRREQSSCSSVRYCWKEEAFRKVPLPGDNTCRHIGFLAQEVQYLHAWDAPSVTY